MPVDTKRIEKFKQILKLTTENITREEFTKAFKTAIDHILRIEKELIKKNQKELEQAKSKLEALKNATEADLRGFIAEQDKRSQKTLKEQENGLNFIRDKVRRIKEGKDGKDGADGKAGEAGRDGANGRDGKDADEKAIKKSIAKELKKDLKTLKDDIEATKRIRRTGGGITDVGVKFSLGRLVQKETPSGVIDGSNKTFTVSNTIHTVLSLSINGMAIQDDEYSVSGRTITFNTAIPASLSGTSFRICYI